MTGQSGSDLKIPCTLCGVPILPRTAEETGGKCMPCKHGTRERMEESRAYYQREREYDPHQALWHSLVFRANEDCDLNNLSEKEVRYYSAVLLEGEIYNGGFDQYFSNSSGNYYAHAVDCLKEIEAHNALQLVEEASRVLFGNIFPPLDREKRWNIMYSRARKTSEFLLRGRRERKLAGLDRQFWEDPDSLGDRLMAYAETHDLITPFLNDRSHG